MEYGNDDVNGDGFFFIYLYPMLTVCVVYTINSIENLVH